MFVCMNVCMYVINPAQQMKLFDCFSNMIFTVAFGTSFH